MLTCDHYGGLTPVQQKQCILHFELISTFYLVDMHRNTLCTLN